MRIEAGFEIDFLPVGENSKHGDAISIRYGYPENYKIIVIDGGTKTSGKALVEHIQLYYNTNFVDYVINTHPDSDHATGLKVILEELEVGELWMHLPWTHSQTIRDLFKDGRMTDNSLEQRIKGSLSAVYALYELAEEKGVPIYEPFEGTNIGVFTVMSPNRDWYLNELLPAFKHMPEIKEEKISSFIESMQEISKRIANKIIEFIEENWDVETLKNDVKTSERNESSVILHSHLNGLGILLTGDSGIQALSKAADYAESLGIDFKNCRFIQVPHHGSRHNVSPDVLDRIIGSKVSQNEEAKKSAYASVSKGADDYPRRSVANAFKRRGVNVFATKGRTKTYSVNMPEREGWHAAEPLPFYSEVEK
ncbi:ComEC/Rec2 family competence protein [Priestia aryabhattai]|uniref:ComEC/Rec2 family competence protein n=1 Tax=Priestia aryabhattai TaxID=412384 RepID=UPI001CCF740F|nr:MBL fold metallo-hydrolase [Priestia aryabhattai]MBZ6485057.1 MBL fold metallo-hydrolase [Priestia aryabhattai]